MSLGQISNVIGISFELFGLYLAVKIYPGYDRWQREKLLASQAEHWSKPLYDKTRCGFVKAIIIAGSGLDLQLLAVFV